MAPARRPLHHRQTSVLRGRRPRGGRFGRGRPLYLPQATEDRMVVCFSPKWRTMVDVQLQSEGRKRRLVMLEILGLELVVPPFVPGCADSTACNFNPSATLDDGSVSMSMAFARPVKTAPSWTTTPTATASATWMKSRAVCPLACNYDATPTTDSNDALCVFPAGCESCSGETDGSGTVVDNDVDNDGVCDADEIVA